MTCKNSTYCLTCDTNLHFYLSSSICLCITNYILQTNQCILSVNCLSNQYYNSSQNLCLGCNTLCKTCTNDTDCTDCISTFILSSYKCICNSNSYYNISTISCISCSITLIGCLTCQNSTYCLTCDTNLHFYLSSSICLCLPSFFSLHSFCLSCSSFILGCISCSN
jgi:proprotein convertase subtilisin/kexin type 5